MRVSSIRPMHVEFIPKSLEDGIFYISNRFNTASHNCCCGCGVKIVTPLRETEYSLKDKNGTISLYPSIGNWNFPCQSHYWIRNNKIIWATQWSRAEINAGREQEIKEQEQYFIQEQPKSRWFNVGRLKVAMLKDRFFSRSFRKK